MTKETLLLTLEAEKLKVGGESISVPEEREATFMIAGPSETIQVSKVVKIESRESVLGLETAKGERYWFTYDLVLGVCFRLAKTAKEHTAGFSR
jgi:hypothetical protein